ncbi:hypothetical protein ACLMAJ_10990 [Nocardia sp. KC 131]|uniref:hypothetical protein n=1 Tax=Nocardia arseniciresistens TaxID=3392119 RepID=UPI00398F68A9
MTIDITASLTESGLAIAVRAASHGQSSFHRPATVENIGTSTEERELAAIKIGDFGTNKATWYGSLLAVGLWCRSCLKIQPELTSGSTRRKVF